MASNTATAKQSGKVVHLVKGNLSLIICFWKLVYADRVLFRRIIVATHAGRLTYYIIVKSSSRVAKLSDNQLISFSERRI